MKNREEERLAVIFRKAIDYQATRVLNLNCGVLVTYDTFTDKFKIKYGDARGISQKAFNILKGEPYFIYENDVNLRVWNLDDFKSYIYVFDKKFVSQIKRDQNLDTMDAYLSIIKQTGKVDLTPKRINTFLLPTNFKSILTDNEMPYADSLILSELYGPRPPEAVTQRVQELITEELKEAKRKIDTARQNLSNSPFINFIINGSGSNVKLLSMNAEPVEEENYDSTSDEEEEEIDYKDIDVSKIIADISKKIVGQEEAIETLTNNIYYNQVLIDSIEDDSEAELDSRKVTILLDGSTGTGKTAIAKEIAKKLDLPIVITNANSFSETGYVGPTITDTLKKLVTQTNGDIEKAERGIIVLDEIDKIAVQKEIGHSMKKGVQEELLAFIGGGKYDLNPNGRFGKNESFDTSRITFILMGAFTEIRDNKIKEAKSKIGFERLDGSNKSYTIDPEDYIKFGLMREFFGRVKVLASTKTYTKEDLNNILLKSEISPLKNFEKTARMFGYKGISYDTDFINKIVEEAYKMNTGARGLQTIMSGIQNRLLTDLVNHNYDIEQLVNLDQEVLEEYKLSKVRKIES